MYCEIIDFDATTCALALDSGHITHVGQLSHSTIPSGKVYGFKRSCARKKYTIITGWHLFPKKNVLVKSFIAGPHINADRRMHIKYILNIKGIC